MGCKKEEIKTKILYDPIKRQKTLINIAERKALIIDIYNSRSNNITPSSKWLEAEIAKRINPEKYNSDCRIAFFDTFDEFIDRRKYSDLRKRAFDVVIRALKRYEIYTQLTEDESFILSLNAVTPAILQNFELFLINEHLIAEKYPVLYKAVPESRTPKPRGRNTLNAIFVKLRTFFIWANDNGKTHNNPFNNYQIKEAVYGTPYIRTAIQQSY